MKNINDLNNLVEKLAHDPHNPELLFALGYQHEILGEHAGAVTFYLKAAEYTHNPDIAYESLCRMFIIYMMAGRRNTTAKRCLNQAIALQPNRPEAYYLLSQFYEKTEEWQEYYTTCEQGLFFVDNKKSTITGLDFYHSDQFLFGKAVSAWWLGRFEEAIQLFHDVLSRKNLQPHVLQIAENNLKSIDYRVDSVRAYVSSDHDLLRYKFSGSEKIQKNFSQCMQDIFVLCMTNGKKGGTYLEIGSCTPFHTNNTALLETQFGWTGQSIEIEKDYCEQFNAERKNPCHHTDARNIDYQHFIDNTLGIQDIDYLQIDCEPVAVSYDVLTKIPFDKYRFAVITFEHDYYLDEEKLYRQKSRKLLEAHGYKLVAGNISVNHRDSFEDWWVHPDLVDSDILEIMTCANEYVLFVEDYLLCGNKVLPKKTPEIKLSVKENTAEKSIIIPTKHLDVEHWRATPWPTLEITTNIAKKGCVVDCVYCPQRILEKSYVDEKRFLTLDDFKRALESVPTEIRITFAGFTEPWLNKYATDMALYAHRRGHPVSAFTTAVGMKPDDVYRLTEIPFAGQPNGDFCLHLPDQQRLAKHPINDNYIQVIKAFHEQQHNITNFTTMCMSDQVHEAVAEWFPHAHVPEFYNRAGNLLGEAMLKPELDEVKHIVRSAPEKNHDTTCGCPEELYHNVMLPNGDVSLCCMDYSIENILGNLFTQRYNDIMPAMKTCFDICRKCENGVHPDTKEIK